MSKYLLGISGVLIGIAFVIGIFGSLLYSQYVAIAAFTFFIGYIARVECYEEVDDE